MMAQMASTAATTAIPLQDCVNLYKPIMCKM